MDDHKNSPMPGMPPMGGPGGPGGPGMPSMGKPVVLPDLDFEHMTLDWDQYQGRWKLGESGKCYELRFVYYVTHIESKEHQYMNIFVPKAYLNADGTINETGTCHGYTARTAPIVFENGCAGWKSSTPGGENPDCIENGFVYISVGARSRDLPKVGKAPSACVDQKAGVRFLRLHGDKIPGNKERIISCGTSGGGQMSSILGATGNMPDYYPWLYEMGAAGIGKAADGSYVSTLRDDIYASQCYCPIADINNADLAYAWLRFDAGETAVEDMMAGHIELTPFQLELQKDLAQAYCGYLNSLELRNQQGELLSFPQRADGTYDPRDGSFYRQILKNISDGLNAWLGDKVQPDGSLKFMKAMGPFRKEEQQFPSVEAYFASLSDTDQWLRQNADGSYAVTDLGGFLRGTGLKRNKDIPGFDTFHLTAENDAFGEVEERAVHFSASVAVVLEQNYDRYKTLPGFEACDVDAYIQQGKREDLERQTYIMNATHILLDCARGRQKTDFSRFWRTRNGAADEHTSFSIAYDLCMAARMAGAEADYALIWNAPHGDVDGDGTGSFAEWVHRIVQ